LQKQQRDTRLLDARQGGATTPFPKTERKIRKCYRGIARRILRGVEGRVLGSSPARGSTSHLGSSKEVEPTRDGLA